MDSFKSKILIVDDSLTDIQTVVNILKSEGYTLFFANNGKKALQRCKIVDFDLILIDVDMPSINGYELCEHLKNDSSTKEIPIIFISNYTDSKKIIKGFEIGGVDYVVKPFNETELKVRVHTHIKLKIEQKRNQDLLSNILPIKVINSLKKNQPVPAQEYKNVAILFTDLIGFTKISGAINPDALINELNDIFTHFDDIMEHHHCERIKTIGDAYMAVSGLCHTLDNENTTDNILRAAIEMHYYLQNRKSLINKKWEMRIGINTGDVIGGVVGIKKYAYDIFGKAVNIAARMEQHSVAGKINLSKYSYDILKDSYDFVQREKQEVKGIGKFQMYFLDIE